MNLFYSIKARSLPRFWYYSFHFMDYQKYAFEMLTNVGLPNIIPFVVLIVLPV
jgi:hypothetical protein